MVKERGPLSLFADPAGSDSREEKLIVFFESDEDSAPYHAITAD